jgi:hypothetical protein
MRKKEGKGRRIAGLRAMTVLQSMPMFISTALSKDGVSIGYDGVGGALTTR